MFARSSCALVTRQVMLDGYRWHKHLMRDSRISGYIFGYHLSDQYGTSSGQNPPVKSDQERKPHRCVIYSAGDISLSSLIILHRSRRMAMRIRGAMSVVVGMRSSLPGGRGQQIQELQVQGPCSGIYSDSNVSEILTAGPKTTTEANCSRHHLSHLIESFLVVQTRRRDCTYDPRFV